MFLGATIHDVAQVVGAGYSMSRETGDVATLVKLMRVAMLLPVIVFAVMFTRAAAVEAQATAGDASAAAALVRGRLRGAGRDQQHRLGAALVVRSAAMLSRWCLVAAIAAIGMKTQLKDLATVGLKPVVLMLGETIFLAVLVSLLLRWLSLKTFDSGDSA